MIKVIIKKIKELYYRLSAFFLTTKDPLTNLSDRSGLKKFKAIKVNGEVASVVFLDLDNFKKINDSLGHQFGDIFLKEFADLLKREVRNRDILIRWGGDEFIVILFNASDKEAKSFISRIKLKTDQIDITRRKDYISLKESVKDFPEEEIKKRAKEFGVSGGFSKIEDDISKAISFADQRMYEDKNYKKNDKDFPERKKVKEIIANETGFDKAEIIVQNLEEEGYLLFEE